jgi:hypothetical protein
MIRVARQATAIGYRGHARRRQGLRRGRVHRGVASHEGTPHVAQNKSGRRSAVADEVARSEGYAISQRKRKLIEQGFGWAKLVGPIRQVMVRGIKKVDQLFVLTMAAYNLVRMRTLAEVRPLAP